MLTALPKACEKDKRRPERSGWPSLVGLIAALLTANGCGAARTSALPHASNEPLVLAAVLDSLGTRGLADQLIVTASTTDFGAASLEVSVQRLRWLLGPTAPVDSAIMHNFVVANTDSRLLPRPARTRSRVRVVPVSDLQALRARPSEQGRFPVDAFWDAFHEAYPGTAGFIALSRVGFNADATRGLVAIHSACGTLCGRFDYVLLERGARGWRIVWIHRVGVS